MKPFGRRETGAVAVEFALIVPLVVALLFGAVGFGIAFAQELALGNAARQGARFAAVSHTCSQIVDETQSAAVSLGMAPDDVEVVVSVRESPTGPLASVPGCFSLNPSLSAVSDPPCKGRPSGTSVHVETKFVGSLVIPMTPVDSPTFNLDSTGEFRCEAT